MKLKDIKKSITELPWQEQLEIHRRVQESRLVVKRWKKAAKPRVTKKAVNMALQFPDVLQKEAERLGLKI